VYKDILRKINFFIYLFIAVFIAILQSTFFSYFPLYYIHPDITLIVVVYLGFKRDILSGGIITIFIALIIEAHSSVAPNFFLTVYLYSFVITKILSRILVLPDILSSICVVAALTFLKQTGLLVLLELYGKAENGIKHVLIYLFPAIVVQVLLTFVIFPWLRKIDLKTFKDEHAEDEYDIHRE